MVAAAKTKPEHPKYSDMIVEAITTQKERTGSSRQAIKKFVSEKYNLDTKNDVFLKAALKRGIDTGLFVHPKNKTGSYRIGVLPKEKKKVAPKKKAVAKKPATKKKPAAKKKVVKKAAPKKKTAVKKAAPKKKPAAKKTAAKK
ncbi:hypothetical protein SARC_01038 [Sphaeroforma arctica JP610]|uniref:H15 domain-containing protein n=1 Tax=Sphaeroforma arctica JP610 TaxID=667725 RepID=A0A0L0GCV1_9EUKA|nr:hypothetical protein SARC_01038 [Sphaeroforma arctica JP610]KNC86845.1 hypothetical protein SARC_01038 [Sphaeroforma arctica JP610]|eukprot:XP_014160747.1 hypothetical protein SARC_01038 [Sphaeroforma arctica JP610]